jgi:sugar phosphate isomerase/epimerase
MAETTINRRQFVSTALAASAGMLPSHALSFSNDSPQKRQPGMKVGLYSITFLGVWYGGEALPLEEVVKRAKKYGYDGVEIDGKRPHGNPLDMPQSRCRELRSMADGEGIEIYGVAANNDFSSPITEHRECQILYTRELIRMASDLGAKTLRVFLAWPGVTQHPQIARYTISRPMWDTVHRGFSDEEIWGWCRDGLTECARYAGDAGITLALQNHAPVIKSFKDVLRMVRDVNSSHLKVSLDASIMPEKTPEFIREASMAVGSLQALSHFGGEYERGADGKVKGEEFYQTFVRCMREIGYEGYVGYELCHSLPVVDGQTVGIECAEKHAQMAAEFMRGLIDAEWQSASVPSQIAGSIA